MAVCLTLRHPPHNLYTPQTARPVIVGTAAPLPARSSSRSRRRRSQAAAAAGGGRGRGWQAGRQEEDHHRPPPQDNSSRRRRRRERGAGGRWKDGHDVDALVPEGPAPARQPRAARGLQVRMGKEKKGLDGWMGCWPTWRNLIHPFTLSTQHNGTAGAPRRFSPSSSWTRTSPSRSASASSATASCSRPSRACARLRGLRG